MRANTLSLLSLALVILAAPCLRAQDSSFALTELTPPTTLNETMWDVSVEASGALPSDLSDPKHWRLFLQPKTGLPTRVRVTVTDVRNSTNGKGHNITMTADLASIQGLLPPTEEFRDRYIWSLALDDAPAVTWKASKLPKHLIPAVAKDDANLYFFGSVLAGAGTKPLYTLDTKAALLWEAPRGLFYGANFTLTANQSASAPVSSSRINPDSITASLVLQKRHHPHSSLFQKVTLEYDLKPGYEFAATTPSANFITVANLAVRHTPIFPFGPGVALIVYPSIGFEGGKNLKQPTTLFKQPVDLSRWNGIARIAPAATTGLYVLPKVGDLSDTPYKYTFTATYQPRIPLTLEPFVTTVGSGDTATQLTTLRKNTRHEVEAAANWNFNNYVGIALKYRYGSLPPLFTFVDQQITVGLIFKGILK